MPNPTKQSGRSSKQQSLQSSIAELPLRVFVFLAHGFGADGWTKRWTNGEIPGLNERLPYGYYHAESSNCVVEHSEDARENRVMAFVRRSIRKLAGCDLVHAWRNRKAIFSADVVWTHTELEHIVVLALWQLNRCVRRPKLIAQSVWLFDRWPRLSKPKRWIYRLLMSQADVLTVLSPENLKTARELFPGVRTELMLFGVMSDATVPPEQCRPHRPLRIASLGSDMHRDWQTLISVAESWPGCMVRIASTTLDRRMLDQIPNVAVIVPKTAREISELYAWADVAVVPLKPNLHASGIKVILEAVLCGIPVIATDTGGLRAYFSDDEVRYVAPGDAAALRRTLEEFAADDHMRFLMAGRAQRRVYSADLTSRGFALRHYELSRQIERGYTPLLPRTSLLTATRKFDCWKSGSKEIKLRWFQPVRHRVSPALRSANKLLPRISYLSTISHAHSDKRLLHKSGEIQSPLDDSVKNTSCLGSYAAANGEPYFEKWETDSDRCTIQPLRHRFEEDTAQRHIHLHCTVIIGGAADDGGAADALRQLSL